MECNNIQEKISSYIDERLSPEEKMQVDEHLGECPECRRSFEELQKTVAVMRELDEVEPPPWLEQKVMASIRERERRKQWLLQKLFFPIHIKVPLEIVAAAAIAVTAFFVFRTIEPDFRTMYEDQAVTQSDRAISDDRKDEIKQYPLRKEGIASSTAPQPEKRQVLVERPDISAIKKEAVKKPEAPVEKELPPDETFQDMEAVKGRDRSALSPGIAGIVKTKKLKMRVTVFVQNMEDSVRGTELVIKKLKGAIIKREHFENRNIIIAALDPEKIPDLQKELKKIGQVKEEPGEYSGEKIEITIELLRSFQ